MISIKKAAGLFAAIAMIVPMTASAFPVTWKFDGTVTTLANIPATFPLTVNMPFTMSLTFNPDNFVNLQTDPGGAWNYFSGTDMQFSVEFPVGCNGTPGPCKDSPTSISHGEIWLLNQAFGAPGDGLVFSLFPFGVNDGQRWNFRAAGPADVYGAAAPSTIPVTLDDRFNSLAFSFCDGVIPASPPASFAAFNGCKADEMRIVANLTAAPEPGTLALMTLSLAGLGFTRRRKLPI